DAILLSSDKIKFHVSKVVLSIASPFFQDMFGLPQAPDSDPEGSVIPVTENSSILNALLRICYPIPDPTVSQPMDLYQLVITADKYHLPAVTNWARERLLAVARDQPLAAYAAACCLGWNPEAKLSAKEALKFTVAELEAFSEGSGLELVSCECIRRLLAYHRAC
ncbi:hypothetical protein PUNSTDRAFT_15879, partial [Punctularia strigosozonata HHB-11173 SS5]|uniref:uncharacterized protein n=1 Tax=Punctularia strigosozonata (strain HHB-11173) TaxID=741275 RepID=UPI00044174CB